MPDLQNFRLVSHALDVEPIRQQLLAQPDLWNQRDVRRLSTSPHRETSDIWVRYRPENDLRRIGDLQTPHFAAFYPAWHRLPEMHQLVYGLMSAVQAVYLGGILITKIPPGCQVYPHDDRGSWHAEYLNCKVYVPLQAPAECVNWCDGEELVMREGEAWEFNNLLPHSVVNRSPDTDRITLIVCMRVEA